MTLPLPSQNVVYPFTTSTALARERSIELVQLNDKSLGVHKLSSPKVLTHRVVKPPAPSQSDAPADQIPVEAWEAFYPAGSINPSAPIKGGFGFYLSGPPQFSEELNKNGAVEAVMGYEVMFEEGWQWAKGGKLPGVFGGMGDFAYRCTGGRSDDRCKCFDIRLMWRADGLGELYTYLPMNETNSTQLLAVPPFSRQNPDSGFSVGRGAWTFRPGRWTKVAIRVKLNDVGAANANAGELELWIDGKSVISVTGLIHRDDPASHIKGMHIQTFFGGYAPDWACPKDQRAWFASVSGAVIRSA
ncbi:hypothetical protein EWM64_g6086 [Hericium alpestre]|uniref:Polysaccharide lyase 14 domain-containing protein n=1 Tax=Hericium alpestre TaxID=135208 RepID=A0A4Y9ZWR2_9AGAM|nr:hypothetical protein EWM64_g6086 [Hericium alpestre]